MSDEKDRQIKIEIIEAIRDAEDELGFEFDAYKEVGLSEIIFNKIKEHIK